MLDFNDKVALVTGAGRGLGRAYATALAARGAKVIVHDIGAGEDGLGQDASVAETVADALRTNGGDAWANSDPVETKQQCAALVERITAAHGSLDILIHNAGWVGYRSIEELDPDFMQRMTGLAIEGSLWLAQAAWAGMRARGFGRILLTTSDRAIYPDYAQSGLVTYAAAKMAVIGIANILAHEGAAHGILVNAISPVAKTRMWGVTGEPDELTAEAVAAGALYLVSPESRETGWVLRAANGQFVATRALEATGVDYPRDLRGVTAATIEEVAQAWPRIAVSQPEPRTTEPAPVATAVDAAAILGECPLWSERRQRLLWVDTQGRTLNFFDPRTGGNESWPMPDDVGMVAERADGKLLVALGCDLALVEDDRTISRLGTAPHGRPGYRLNDGRVDDAGRLWIGLMDGAIGEGTGKLYRVDPDGRWAMMDENYTLINGLDWSPDRRTLYVTDSRAPCIYAFDTDPLMGSISNRRVFANFADGDGFPDGLLVDPDGTVWSTLFDGGAIRCFAPDGNVLRNLALPAPRPTSCTFGPDGLLYVTTARLGLDTPALDRFPASGALLRCRI